MMKKTFIKAINLLTVGIFLLNFTCPVLASPLEEEPFYNNVIEAYIYGLPLVLMDVTKKVMTNVSEPDNTLRAPINQFSHLTEIVTPSNHDVVSPNVDTLYSNAFLDLSKEPLVLHVPDTKGRYYLLPMLDAWSNVFASPGKRTTGTAAQDFVIVGPKWDGILPKNMIEIRSPTNMVWILGRTQVNGPDDLDAVRALQKQYTLTPLSMWGKDYVVPTPAVDPTQDAKSPIEQVAHMDEATFFNQLALLMGENPPATVDKAMIKKLASIGVVPGKPYVYDDRRDAYKKQMDAAFEMAKLRIETEGLAEWKWKSNWLLAPILGSYGSNYFERAVIAWVGLGANIADDAIYPMINQDSQGFPLNGSHKYVMHFNKENIPPVNAFWSLTMYDQDHFFVSNDLNRYALGDRDNLKYNEDGSLDIYIQAATPSQDKKSNWLPAPKEGFNIMLRLYWPKEEVVKGVWEPPVMIR